MPQFTQLKSQDAIDLKEGKIDRIPQAYIFLGMRALAKIARKLFFNSTEGIWPPALVKLFIKGLHTIVIASVRAQRRKF